MEGPEIVNPNLTFQGNFARNVPEYIIIHHALKSNCTVHDVHRWHLANGWNGIGYHYFIDKTGIVFRGRQDHQSGAHAPPLNRRSLGICLEGCYQEYKDQTDRNVPGAQLEALEVLVRFLMGKYGVPIEKVEPHSAYSQKLCPGNYFPWRTFIENLKTGGEEVKGLIIIYSVVDIFTVEELMQRTGYPVITRQAYQNDVKAEEIYIVGGPKDIDAGKVIHLAGNNRYETAARVGEYLNRG